MFVNNPEFSLYRLSASFAFLSICINLTRSFIKGPTLFFCFQTVRLCVKTLALLSVKRGFLLFLRFDFFSIEVSILYNFFSNTRFLPFFAEIQATLKPADSQIQSVFSLFALQLNLFQL